MDLARYQDAFEQAGLSPDVLHVWEQRDAAVDPRADSRRTAPPLRVARFRLLAAATGVGAAPASSRASHQGGSRDS
jgi:hypothetical protein